jgi:carbon storage regulator
MLVLTRRIGDSIVVDDNIRISVVSIGGGKVRLAIDAPAEVPVNRLEIHERILAARATGTPALVAC